MEEEFEGVGAAASAFLDILDRLPGAAAAAFARVTSQADEARNGLKQGRDELGRFSAAGSGAQSILGKSFESIASGSKTVASAITSVGSVIDGLASGSIPSAQEAMSKAGEMLGGALTGGAHQAAEALGALGPEGEAAGAALEGLAAVASATIGTLTTLMGTALEVNEALSLMRSRFDALAGGAAAGAQVNEMVQRLGTTLPVATSQVATWAQSLQAAGLQGGKLEQAVKAVAAASALMGEQGGAAAQNFLKRLGEGGPAADKMITELQKGGRRTDQMLKNMGLSTKDLAKAMGMTPEAFAKAKISADQLNGAVTKALQAKGAGPLEAMSNSLPNILSKAQEGIRSLFDGLGPAIEPFMAQVKGLFGEFSKGGVAINTLKPIVTAAFSTLFAWGTKAVNAIHRGFLMLTIAGLQAYIAMRPLIASLKEFVTSASFIMGLKAALVVLGVVLLIVLSPLIAIGIAFLAIVAAGAALVAGIVYVGGMLIDEVGSWLTILADLGPGALEAAGNFVAGLVDGITAGAAAVIAAVKGLASGAMDTFTGFFGIRSPSTKMLVHGQKNIAEDALAEGIDRGAPAVDDAMARLGSGEPGNGAKGKGAGSKSAAGRVVNFTNCTFGSGITEEQIRGWVLRVLEQEAAGGPEPVTS